MDKFLMCPKCGWELSHNTEPWNSKDLPIETYDCGECKPLDNIYVMDGDMLENIFTNEKFPMKYGTVVNCTDCGRETIIEIKCLEADDGVILCEDCFHVKTVFEEMEVN